MNGSEDDLSDNDNWTWTSKSESRRNYTKGAGSMHDPGVELLRHIVEVWLTTPIVLLGIAGNVVAFFVLCQHRRHKLQTTTIILQVTSLQHHYLFTLMLMLRFSFSWCSKTCHVRVTILWNVYLNRVTWERTSERSLTCARSDERRRITSIVLFMPLEYMAIFCASDCLWRPELQRRKGLAEDFLIFIYFFPSTLVLRHVLNWNIYDMTRSAFYRSMQPQRRVDCSAAGDWTNAHFRDANNQFSVTDLSLSDPPT